MTEDEAYKVHIQYTFNAFCKVVIRHAAIDKILKLRRRWEREVSLDYLMNEKFVQFAASEPDNKKSSKSFSRLTAFAGRVGGGWYSVFMTCPVVRQAGT